MTTIESLTQKLALEESISTTKTTFEKELKAALGLHKVMAPAIVMRGTGINDDLNGIERPVQFPIKAMDERPAEVVQSLAKWKRLRLAEYDLPAGVGIVTDMRALRPDEDFSPIHSISVDQWDWEKVILPEQRSLDFLKTHVQKIYGAIRATETKLAELYPALSAILPEEIQFIQAEDLMRQYPDLTAKERENKVAEEFGAVFIIGIGHELSHGQPHDGRSPDYDDWSTSTSEGYYGLNGDIILWNPVLKKAFEISSMGIRVDQESLERQLQISGQTHRKAYFFHQRMAEGALPQTMGGGIGQSRMAMFMLRKQHIAEVQVSIWPESIRDSYRGKGINFL